MNAMRVPSGDHAGSWPRIPIITGLPPSGSNVIKRPLPFTATIRSCEDHSGLLAFPRISVIDDPSEAAASLAELKAAGFADRDLEVLRGEEGADRMDGTGEVSGWLGKLRRAFDFTLMDQLVDFATYERALRDGRAVVMVHVHGDAPKQGALQILKRHGSHFMNYYGRFATEEHGLWRGPEPDIPGYLRR